MRAAASGCSARNAASSASDPPSVACGPARTSQPSQPCRTAQRVEQASAKTRFLCRKFVPRQSRNAASASAGSAVRPLQCFGARPGGVVDPEMRDADAARVHELVGQCVVGGVLREEEHLVGERERHPRQPLEVVPLGRLRA